MLLSTRHGLFKTTYHWHQRIFQHASRASCSLALSLIQPRYQYQSRHLKERLFRAAKIESFSRLLNSLQAEGDINAQELSKILTQKTAIINEQGNKIWLNLITRETSDPIFYSLEEK